MDRSGLTFAMFCYICTSIFSVGKVILLFWIEVWLHVTKTPNSRDLNWIEIYFSFRGTGLVLWLLWGVIRTPWAVRDPGSLLSCCFSIPRVLSPFTWPECLNLTTAEFLLQRTRIPPGSCAHCSYWHCIDETWCLATHSWHGGWELETLFWMVMWLPKN